MAESRADETGSRAKPGLVCALLSPPPPALTPWGYTVLHSTSLPAMPTGAQPPMTDDLTVLTARLDGLSTDQNPEDLSRALVIAFKECELYGRYLSSLVGDVNRTKALLEVFDKVHLENACYSMRRFSTSPCDTGSHGPQTRCEDIQEVSPALWSGRITPRFPHHT